MITARVNYSPLHPALFMHHTGASVNQDTERISNLPKVKNYWVMGQEENAESAGLVSSSHDSKR